MPIFLIIIICIVVFLFLIAIIVAIIGQTRVNSYRKQRKHLEQEIILAQNSFDRNGLVPMDLPYQLPEGEFCYYTNDEVKVYLSRKKELKNNLLYSNEIKNDSYYIYQLSGFLNIGSIHSGIDFMGKIFISNRRMIIDTPDATKTILLKDVLRVSPSVIYQNGIYQSGFLVFTKNNIYKIATKDALVGIVTFNCVQLIKAANLTKIQREGK